MMTASIFGELADSLWWLFPLPVLMAMVFTPWFKEHIVKKLHASTTEEEPFVELLMAPLDEHDANLNVPLKPCRQAASKAEKAIEETVH
ncbi:hypothetical protein [Bacterioplanoides sp.]|uniref:hypothetical protein n=1 Tax=Bacterioplanoides sp. TaxID=2066072 RepID=UPI003AFFC12F